MAGGDDIIPPEGGGGGELNDPPDGGGGGAPNDPPPPGAGPPNCATVTPPAFLYAFAHSPHSTARAESMLQYCTHEAGRLAQTAPHEAVLEQPSGGPTRVTPVYSLAAAVPTTPTNAMDKIGRIKEDRIKLGFRV